MKEVNYIIDCLERTPTILRNLINHIPEDLVKIRRLEDKWSIHEQVCHLVDAQDILMGRFRQFESEDNPLIKSYTPPEGRDSDHYLQLDMHEELNKFPSIRKEMLQMLRSFDISYWQRQGRHDVFNPYNTVLLLTHSLNVDYAHMFSIEQLGLTKTGFEHEIMTIP